MTQANVREGAPLQLAVRVETAMTAQLARPMSQVMIHHMTLKGSHIQENVICLHRLTGLGEDKLCGHHIAGHLSAGILLILLLRQPGEEGQGPHHL